MVFVCNIPWDLVHGSRPVKGNPGYDILEGGWPELLHELLHAGAFQLKHTIRIPLAEHIINRCIIQRNGIDIKLFPVAPPNHPDRIPDHRQGAQTEKIHFQQSQLFQRSHGKLGGNTIIVFLQRNIIRHRLPGDQNTGRMSGCMSRQSFQLPGHINQGPGGGILPVEHFQLLIPFHCLVNGHSDFIGNHPGNPIHFAIGHVQSPSHIPDGSSGCHGAKGNDLGHMILPIFPNDIINDFLPSFIAEIHINIRHADTLRIQEALKQQAVLHRIDLRDIQGIGHQTPGGTASTRSDNNPVVPGIFDKVPYNEEIVHISHLNDGLELILQAIPDFFRHFRISFLQPFVAEVPEILLCGTASRNIILREVEPAEFKPDMTPVHDPHGIFQSFRILPKQKFHFLRGFQVELRSFKAEPVGILYGLSGLDAEQDIMGIGILPVDIVHVIGRDQRNAGFPADPNQPFIDLSLGRQSVVLQFQIKGSLSKNPVQAVGGSHCIIIAPLFQQLGNLSCKTCAEPNQAP